MNRASFLFIVLIFLTFQIKGQNVVNLDFADLSGIKAVVLANINGDVNVEGVSGKQMMLEGTIDPKANDPAQYTVEHITVNDTLVIYIKSPCSSVKLDPEEGFFKASWSIYHWNETQACKDQSDYNIDLKLTIPHPINLSVSTINNGNLKVEAYKGHLWAKNINGSIVLNGVKEVHEARTINGDVTIHFVSSPHVEGSFYTLNGDIESFYPRNTNMDFTFKSFNGDFYTDTDDMVILASDVTNESSDKGFKIKIAEQSKMRLGKGGPAQKYETFNGDAIIRTKAKL